MPQPRGSHVVFVGNIPYDMTEEQLANVFREVGNVVAFRLVFDRDTGKPKGYGFCEYEDSDTAKSAVRNLNEVDVGGRNLRVDFADPDERLEGKTTTMGQLNINDLPPSNPNLRPTGPAAGAGAGAGRGGAGPVGVPGNGWAGAGRGAGGGGAPPGPAGAPADQVLPQGQPLQPGVSSADAITRTLAALPPQQLMDIMSHMKALVTSSPEQAASLLSAHPQLAYALFQAMLMMNVVDPALLQRILTSSGALGGAAPPTNAAPPAATPAPQSAPIPTPRLPPAAAVASPVPAAAAPMPPPTHAPAAAPSQPAQIPPGLGDQQKALLMQVLKLTDEQINALPPEQKASIMQLKAQYGRA
ncbi:unnamed protein product [Tilletia controversa]|uniref:RRM domain-containing protein n=3 Tax=Tilletia TaxID=13289 RepID=A0A8X7SXY2_9BASI|nr:hypothetical protein CF336_g6534 [Tilletia laevis]KAE8189964.1 hypothetical protein CF328_g6117 [Tilletia controversa]KAE8253567.1 hypothetical protein A4X03_0g5860 [Tilletia caries]KAE8192404.1 hypothetical protein CF335_g5843 [Tilletia laevis]KAE8248518.1 hypothetical protein A4X06_0g3653 [Tilletia controversa]